jgi:hypothetical protein
MQSCRRVVNPQFEDPIRPSRSQRRHWGLCSQLEGNCCHHLISASQLSRGALRGDAAVSEDCNPIGQAFSLFHVVRREQNGGAAGSEPCDGRPCLSPS